MLPPGSVALVTSATEPLMRARMRAAGLPVPDVVVTAEQVAEGKPDPEGYLRAARLLGVDPEDAIVFEDAPAGLAAARSAGMRAVAIGDGGGPEADGLPRLENYRDLDVHVASDGTISLRF